MKATLKFGRVSSSENYVWYETPGGEYEIVFENRVGYRPYYHYTISGMKVDVILAYYPLRTKAEAEAVCQQHYEEREA